MTGRSKRVFATGGGVGLILLVVAVLYLFCNLTAYRFQTRFLDQQYSRLAELKTRTPFPSLDNVAVEQKNLAIVEGMASKAGDGLMFEADERVELDIAEFSARTQEVIEGFRKRAAAATVVLSENLEAGFAEYASGGAIPDVDQVPRLSRQLFSIEKIADILIQCGVSSIDALTRDSFEKPPVELSAVYSRRHAREISLRIDPMECSEEPSTNLYASERIGVVFTAKEATVWAVLEQLVAAPHVMVVRDFSHKTETDILSYQPGDLKESAITSKEVEGLLAKKHSPSRAERIIAGTEQVRVSLEIEVYDFYSADRRHFP
jgi:hypothetical protein